MYIYIQTPAPVASPPPPAAHMYTSAHLYTTAHMCTVTMELLLPAVARHLFCLRRE